MYALISFPASQDWMFQTRFLFLMEIIFEHVSKRIPFGLIILVVGVSFMVWVMVNPTCSDYDPTRVWDDDDGKFLV